MLCLTAYNPVKFSTWAVQCVMDQNVKNTLSTVVKQDIIKTQTNSAYKVKLCNPPLIRSLLDQNIRYTYYTIRPLLTKPGSKVKKQNILYMTLSRRSDLCIAGMLTMKEKSFTAIKIVLLHGCPSLTYLVEPIFTSLT